MTHPESPSSRMAEPRVTPACPALAHALSRCPLGPYLRLRLGGRTEPWDTGTVQAALPQGSASGPGSAAQLTPWALGRVLGSQQASGTLSVELR